MALTEAEILDRHVQALKEAHQACQLLSYNADPAKVAPRGHNYGNLKRALTRLEGTCRQMNYHREDTRWLRLGILYAKAMRTCSALFANQDWIGFGRLMAMFENGMRHMDELANRRTGKSGPILPTQPPRWLQLPNLQRTRPGMKVPY